MHQQLAEAEVADEVAFAGGPSGVGEELGHVVGGQVVDVARLVVAEQDVRALRVMGHRQVGEQVEPLGLVLGRQPYG